MFTSAHSILSITDSTVFKSSAKAIFFKPSVVRVKSELLVDKLLTATKAEDCTGGKYLSILRRFATYRENSTV